jgi:elongation factor P--beta-lysine ligase
MNKRDHFLDHVWTRYPSHEGKVLSLVELKAEFAKATSGQAPKTAEFYLGGRLHQKIKSPVSDQGIEQFSILVEDQEFLCRPQLLKNHAEKLELIRDILVPGDWIKIKCSWGQVHTSGMFPKIDSMTPSEVELLSPNYSSEFPNLINGKRIKQWAHFLELIRKCFDFLQFTEVRTPTLVATPGLEPFLDGFQTTFQMGQQRLNRYLPTSPEFHLKRLLAGGAARIFEFKECFRNGEISPLHQPEFLMMEWYRSFATLDDIIKDLKGLFNYLKLHWPENISASGPLQVKTMSQTFKELLDFELTPSTPIDSLLLLAKDCGVETSASDSWDEVFHRIFFQKKGWYRSFATLDDIIKDLKGLFNYLKLHWPENISASGPLQVKTMSQTFKELLDSGTAHRPCGPVR